MEVSTDVNTSCREILESIYSVPFKPCRPNFLKNPKTGRNLELDGYNEELKIAFECLPLHPSTNYLYQIKKELCSKNNIYLVFISFYTSAVPKKEIRTHIISQLPSIST